MVHFKIFPRYGFLPICFFQRSLTRSLLKANLQAPCAFCLIPDVQINWWGQNVFRKLFQLLSLILQVSIWLTGLFFARLDCSPMPWKWPIQFLSDYYPSFFVSRIFVYLRLAQGLSQRRSAFSSFLRNYMDIWIAVDQWFHQVDDFGRAAHVLENLVLCLVKNLTCIRRSILSKLTMSNREIGRTEITFLWYTSFSEESAQKKNIISWPTWNARKKETIRMPTCFHLVYLERFFMHWVKSTTLLSPFENSRRLNYWLSSSSKRKYAYWFNTSWWKIITTPETWFRICSNGSQFIASFY